MMNGKTDPDPVSGILQIPDPHITVAFGVPYSPHRNSASSILAQRGKINDSWPPQLTAIMICFRFSQNSTISCLFSALTKKLISPQAFFICFLASSY